MDMAFQNGHEKFGGRKKGTLNRKSFRLEDLLSSLGLDPVRRLIELLPSLPEDKQATILLNLMQFLYPKRKALDFTNTEANNDSQGDITLLAEMLLQAAKNPTATSNSLKNVSVKS